MSAEWAPTTEEREDVVTAQAAGSLHDLLDIEGPAPREGDSLPILWHWAAFLPRARQSELGPDGHPRTGTFLPPTDDRVRMYAGGTVDRDGSLRVGERIAKTSRVTSVENKSGRSGELLFVTVGSDFTGEHGTMNERSDIVYKQPTRGGTAPSGNDLSESEWSGGRDVAIDPTLLFRFSALTYNAHRIHYDRRYATDIEGYPGLVVHGPLQAILLADLVRRETPRHAISSFRFRSTAAAFDTEGLQLRIRAGETECELAVFSAGRLTMSATARIAPREDAR
jgi:3-methylfumaryl-CoA hydratase